MDTLYASIKHDIILAIDRSSFSIFANIDFRDTYPSDPNQKKYVDIYRRLLSELNFCTFSEEADLILFEWKNDYPSAFNDLSQLKQTLDERIMTMEREYV